MWLIITPGVGFLSRKETRRCRSLSAGSQPRNFLYIVFRRTFRPINKKGVIWFTYLLLLRFVDWINSIDILTPGDRKFATVVIIISVLAQVKAFCLFGAKPPEPMLTIHKNIILTLYCRRCHHTSWRRCSRQGCHVYAGFGRRDKRPPEMKKRQDALQKLFCSSYGQFFHSIHNVYTIIPWQGVGMTAFVN